MHFRDIKRSSDLNSILIWCGNFLLAIWIVVKRPSRSLLEYVLIIFDSPPFAETRFLSQQNEYIPEQGVSQPFCGAL